MSFNICLSVVLSVKETITKEKRLTGDLRERKHRYGEDFSRSQNRGEILESRAMAMKVINDDIGVDEFHGRKAN